MPWVRCLRGHASPQGLHVREVPYLRESEVVVRMQDPVKVAGFVTLSSLERARKTVMGGWDEKGRISGCKNQLFTLVSPGKTIVRTTNVQLVFRDVDSLVREVCFPKNGLVRRGYIPKSIWEDMRTHSSKLWTRGYPQFYRLRGRRAEWSDESWPMVKVVMVLALQTGTSCFT